MNEYRLLYSIYRSLGESSDDVLQRIEEMGQQPEEAITHIRLLRVLNFFHNSTNPGL